MAVHVNGVRFVDGAFKPENFSQYQIAKAYEEDMRISAEFRKQNGLERRPRKEMTACEEREANAIALEKKRLAEKAGIESLWKGARRTPVLVPRMPSELDRTPAVEMSVSAQEKASKPTSTPNSQPAKNEVGKSKSGKTGQSLKVGSQPTSVEKFKQTEPSLSVSMLRIKQVQEKIGLKRSAIYERINPSSPRYDSTFPKPVQLGLHSNRSSGTSSAVAWVTSEIDIWLNNRIAARHK